MKNGKKDRLAVYLLWAFVIAWILQIAAGMMFRAGAGLDLHQRQEKADSPGRKMTYGL